MLVDELKKTYDLYSRILTKEETVELYGGFLGYIIEKLRGTKTSNYYKLHPVNMNNGSVKFQYLNEWIPMLHFNSIVNYFESEGLVVEYKCLDLIFKW